MLGSDNNMLIVPDYRISACIYESPKSLIYRGVRESDDLPIALKVLKEDYPSTAELSRYRQEYDIMQSLHLEGVVKAYGLEAHQNTLVMLLEDFGGESLADRMREIREGGNTVLPLAEFLWIAIQATAVLGEIHRSGIIHKDINPSNIVYNPYTKQIKIIDFGIASRFSRETPSLKNPELLEGSLGYISPEQTGRMNRTLDFRTDFYSLGVTFYELLTGRLPFMAGDPLELVHCHIALLPLPPHKLNPAIPPILSKLVIKLLEKNADDRYQSAWGIEADLRTCQQHWQQRGTIHPFPLAQQDISDRFLIPQKLYGREKEVRSLLEAFEDVAGAAARENVSKDTGSSPKNALFLVSGYSGIGKTAVVMELYKSIPEKRGYFVSGKFDQLQRNTPYSALVSALTELVRQVLSETEDRLEDWRERILSGLGVNGQIIIDVIPELRLIVGQQPQVPPLGVQESQNRFNLVFQQFIRIFCAPEHPLVIFLDDLQWADSATLGWLHLILTDAQITSLLLIGAYRDNEVGPSHPLTLTVQQLRDTQVQVHEIVVKPLGQEHVARLIAETVHRDEHSVWALADVILQKTGGNPFFINLFLKTLYAEGLIRLDPHSHAWRWEMDQIEAQGITENVVGLILKVA